MEIGGNDKPIVVNSIIHLEYGDILTVDMLYGQQLLVEEILGNNNYSLKLVTNNKEETISSLLFDKDTIWYRYFKLHSGEFSTIGGKLSINNDSAELRLTLV